MKRKLFAVSCVLALVAFHGGLALAEDAPADAPARKTQKATPAAPTAPVSKEDAAAGDEVVREAKAFLSLVRDGADDKAYERMSAEFRKGNTAEDFAKAAGEFRDKAPLSTSVPVSGDVWLKPKDGGPPRASLNSGLSYDRLLRGGGRGGMRPIFLSLSLVREDGKWKVASLQDRMTRDAAISIGKSPRTDRKDPDRFKVSSTLEGKIVKVDDGSMVLRLDGGKEGDPAVERTLKLDEQTAVGNGVEMDGSRGRPAPAGAIAPRSMRLTRGTMSDVKVERRASVEPSDDGTRADTIIVKQQTDPATPSEGL